MGRSNDLLADLVYVTMEHNALLRKKMDAEVQRALWEGAKKAAATAFEYQEQADRIRATGEHVPVGNLGNRDHRLVAESEASCREAMADAFRNLSHELMRMTDTVPSFAQEAGIRF